jgi:hypothetical protein
MHTLHKVAAAATKFHPGCPGRAKNCTPEITAGQIRVAASLRSDCNILPKLARTRETEIRSMPNITVENVGSFEVPQNKRLVLALIDEAKIDQLHSCVANSRQDLQGCKTGCDPVRQAPARISNVTTNGRGTHPEAAARPWPHPRTNGCRYWDDKGTAPRVGKGAKDTRNEMELCHQGFFGK